METKPPKLEEFMRVLNRTGFDATDICKLAFDYSNAHPVLQTMMFVAAEQVETAMKSIGIHAVQLRGQTPFVGLGAEAEQEVKASVDPEWQNWKPSDVSRFRKGQDL
jgi:hypothetical protein